MNPERMEAIYNELSTLVVELDSDPATKGTAYLQDLISKTRGFLNRTSFFLHEVHRERHAVERHLDAQEAAYEVASDELLASDNRVTRLPNIEDRRSMINLLLREERTKILDLKRQIKELGFVEKAIRHRHKELDNTMSSIRMQKSLVDTELRTGAYYGDENNNSRGGIHGRPMAEDIDETELASLLGDLNVHGTKEAVAGTENVTTPKPEPTPKTQDVGESKAAQPNILSSEEEAIERFLINDEFADIFNELEV